MILEFANTKPNTLVFPSLLSLVEKTKEKKLFAQFCIETFV